MDKPQSLTMREYLVRILAPKILVSEKIIDTVIAHQFSEANAALLTNDSIEISGFGKMFFNKKKAIKKMEKFLSQKALFESILADNEISEQKRNTTKVKLNNVLANIDVLKPKLYV